MDRGSVGHTRRMRLAVVTALAAALAFAAAAPSAGGARLRVVAKHPLTVVGSGFRSDERVTVTAIVAGKHVATVRASTSGRFRLRFRRVQVKRCAAYVIAARGSLASFAIVRARSACAAP
jgi:hypothetical protein